jgi:hypothetical protein
LPFRSSEQGSVEEKLNLQNPISGKTNTTRQ